MTKPYEIGVHPQRLDNGSRVSGDVHIRFCERLGVKLPRPDYLKPCSRSSAREKKNRIR